jgi:hypothetical protein
MGQKVNKGDYKMWEFIGIFLVVPALIILIIKYFLTYFLGGW